MEEKSRPVIDYLFGVTGSGKSWSLISDYVNRGVPYIATSHEASAAIMAGAVSVNGCFGASVSIKGPGVTNAIPGIANNYFENRPALSISERYEPDSLKGHKKIDHDALLSPMVKAMGKEDSDLNTLRQLAERGMAGPVHQDLCSGSDINIFPKYDCKNSGHFLGSRPAILIGNKACKSNIDISDFHVPIFTTAGSKGYIDESSEYSAGVFTGAGLGYSTESLLSHADYLYCIDVCDHEVLNYPERCIHLSGFQVDNFKTYISNKEWGSDILHDIKSGLSNYMLNKWLPYDIFRHFNTLNYDFDTVVDVGLFSVVAENILTCSEDRGFYGSLNSRYMGTSIPTAIGVAVSGEKPIFCFMGDGGSNIYLPDIKIASDKSLPICFVIMSDGRYGSIAMTSSEKYQGAVSIQSPGIHVLEGFGLYTRCCFNINSFTDIINKWDKKSPMAIICEFDSEMYSSMIKDLRK